MLIDFVKMHAEGNDYIYVDCFGFSLVRPAEAAVKLSPRRLGVGADGLITMHASDSAAVKIKIYNADGTVAGMCGNALRCVALYMREFRGVKKDEISVETDCGIKPVKKAEGKNRFTVTMGRAKFCESGGIILTDVGNLHRVCFSDGSESTSFDSLENFRPDLYNTEICTVTPDCGINARVYERGSGETMSCGSGACAAAASAVRKGLLRPGRIDVRFPGGVLRVSVDENYLTELTGGAQIVYTGRVCL